MERDCGGGWGGRRLSQKRPPEVGVFREGAGTGVETSDTGGLLDGKLDGLIASVLAMDVSGKSRAEARAEG